MTCYPNSLVVLQGSHKDLTHVADLNVDKFAKVVNVVED